MRFGVVTFPGSNCDQDAVHVVERVLGETAVPLWHKDDDLRGVDAVIVPGGFSFGDYLRCGAIARFSPIVAPIVRFAEAGGYVVGICNGFQILTECGLLPGALLRNHGLTFVCEDARLVTVGRGPWTAACPDSLVAPIAHHDGCYYADDATLERLDGEGRVAFRYADNPNGSLRDIAGITSANGRVLGLMPHPERNAEPLLGDASGASVFQSVLRAFREAA